MKDYKILVILFVLTLISCNNKGDVMDINESDKLIGTWIYVEGTDTGTKYVRSNSLEVEKYSISFLVKNKYIERTSGWCGTPPITFFNYYGHWSRKDSIISIEKEGGINIKLRIESVDDDHLVISFP